jgi:hypothetical protein
MSDCVVEVCPLIYYILKGIKVDIARTISWELRKVALKEKVSHKLASSSLVSSWDSLRIPV